MLSFWKRTYFHWPWPEFLQPKELIVKRKFRNLKHFWDSSKNFSDLWCCSRASLFSKNSISISQASDSTDIKVSSDTVTLRPHCIQVPQTLGPSFTTRSATESNFYSYWGFFGCHFNRPHILNKLLNCSPHDYWSFFIHPLDKGSSTQCPHVLWLYFLQ